MEAPFDGTVVMQEVVERDLIQNLIYRSFRLLDDQQYDEWLGLIAEDIEYVVSTAGSRQRGEQLKVVHDNRDRLKGRIQAIREDWHAEKPSTHTLHLVTNLEIILESSDAAVVHSCFMVFATRREKQDGFAGRYYDKLRKVRGEWRIWRRTAVLESDLIDAGKITFIL
jgi:3-phenylpropionate/cinnamic acid dioxygenase small subunit